MLDHWHVLGAGAMGCLFAQALHSTGARVTLILRTAPAAQVPVVIKRDNKPRECLLDAVTAETCGPIEHLLVTTKAYDVKHAVDSVAKYLSANSTLLLMVNGMGLAEQLGARLPQQRIVCGTSTEGAYKTATRHIQHAGRGVTHIGLQGSTVAPQWFTPWQKALPPCHWDTDIQTALWAKLAVNCVINPLTAIHRCRNGELAQPRYAQDIAQLCREVGQVSYATGHKRIAQTIEQKVAEVIAGTADNRSSMLQDMLHGRPTEIDYINGYLINVAQAQGIEAPLNRALLAKVKAHA
jgi:2-dehydropantoate 2-reductase